MKKSLFFIILSSFAFGQNVDLLKKADNATEAFSQEYNAILYPNYKVIDQYRDGQYTNYTLVPNTTSSSTIEKCKLGNPCDVGVSVRYKDANGKLVFYFAKGDAASLFSFWRKEIDPNIDQSTDVKSYKNDKENIWYNLQPTAKSWMLRNMTYR